jgi:hypothetical protein
MKTNKVIRIEDQYTIHYIITYTSKKLIELDELLGDVKTFLDVDLFKSGPEYCFKKSLFPKSRVQPINLDNITKNTVVILGLRPKHYLINTTLSPDNFLKDVIYDTNRDKINYIFHNFKDTTLAIKPKIAEDNIGLLKYFGENLEDNQIRNTVLHLMNSPEPPKDTLKRLLLERAENFIVYEGDTFAIKYRGGKTIRISNDVLAKDLVYFIQNKITTSKISELWSKLRKQKDDYDDDKALNSFQKNRNRILTNIRKIEDKANISNAERFSKFIEKYIVISTKEISISYEAPEEIRWEFDLPEQLHD